MTSLLTPAEAAAALRCHVKTLQAMARAGEVASVLVGKRRRFDPADVDAFIEARRTRPAVAPMALPKAWEIGPVHGKKERKSA